MKLSRHALTVLTRQYRSVLLKCALINAGLFFAVAPVMAADVTYDPSATVETNLTAFHTAISASGNTYSTNIGGTDYTINQAFAAANPKITRDALAQLLAGSSNAASYAVITTATGDFIDLTGGTVSKSLGYDLSVGGSDITAKLTGTNAAGSDSVIGAINAVDAAVGDLTGTGVTGATVAAQITALDNDKIDTSKIQATLASATTGEVADAKAVKDALDGKQNKLTSTSGNAGDGISISDIGVISVKEGGVTTAMLGGNAVTTGKIQDGNVTKAKLAATVQDSLDKADSALQASALANTALTGTTTAEALKVGGKDVLTTDSTVSADKITGYTGSALETAVGTQISTALANGTDPYQTASDVSAALSAYTKTADLAAVATSGAAADVSYDNTTSGLTATNVQAAIDENASAISSLDTRVTTAESNIATNATAISNALDGTTTFTGFTMADNASGTVTATKIDDGNYSDNAGTTLASNLTVKNALAAKTDLVDENGTIKSKVDVDATNKNATMKVTDGSTVLAGVTVDGVNKKVDIQGDEVVSGKVTVGGTSGAVLTGSATGLSVDKGLAVGTAGSEAFKVNSSGAITNVAGVTSQGALTVTTGGADITGNSTVKGSFGAGTNGTEFKVGTDGGLTIATNKFTVDASNGNVATAGTVTIGSANAITGRTNELDMAQNKLSNVKGIELTDGSAKATLSVDATGFKTSGTSIDVGTGALYSESLNVGSGDEFKVDSSGNVTTSGKATVNSLAIGSSSPMTAIDEGGAAVTGDGSGTKLATTKTVMLSAENAKYSATSPVNATGGTLGSAISNLDSAIGARTALGSLNTTVNTETAKSVAEGLKAAGDAIGSQTYSNSVAVNYGVITAGTDLTTAVSQVASNIGAALTTVADRDASFKLNAVNSVNANLAKLDATIGASVTTTTNGVAATKTVNANIDALNTAMGNVSTVLVNGYTPVVDLVSAVNQLDANMNAVLGGVYKADGSYDQTAIKGTNGFDNKATSNNLTAALKSYADNVMAATGVAYNPDGSVATTYTKATTTDYDGLNANSSLKAAIEQLDGNIGTAITGTTRTATGATTAAASTVNANIAAIDAYLGGDVTVTARTTRALVASNTVKANFEALDAAIGTDADLLTTTVSTAAGDNNGVKVGNSVNRNIAALNAAVGDVSSLPAGTGSTGNAITNGTGTAATTVVEALTNIDATLGQIHGLKNGNSHLQANSNLANGTTVEQHLVSLDDAIGDRSFASTHYIAPHDDLATAATKLDTKLNSLDHEVRKMRHDMDRGLASVSALSALIPNARGTGNSTVSVGTGYYNGHSALAFGGAHWFTDNLMVNVGAAASVGHTRDATYRAGISYSF